MATATVLYENASEHILVQDENNLRSLYLEDDLIQSQIDIANKGQLPLAANRAMLISLLFNDAPKNILLAGCGGGAIARWFNFHLPHSHGIAIEISESIISIAKKYFDFPDNKSHWDIQHADIKEHIQSKKNEHDFILVDIAESNLTPNWITEKSFLLSCKKALTLNGILSINLLSSNAESFMQHLSNMRDCFDKHVICLSLDNHKNIIITAFNQSPNLSEINQKAETLEKIFNIELTQFLNTLYKDNPPNSGVF